MIKKHYYSWTDVENMCVNIVNQMYKDHWRPDYIVGITRGGNVPATIISNMTGIRCEALKVSLRDDDSQSESNTWMAEDALGYPHSDTNDNKKKILIVDDINDTGETLLWIQKDWRTAHYPGDDRWDNIWGDNVRVAVIHNNTPSNFSNVTYVASTINKTENPVWIVYPWEKSNV